MLKSEKVMNAAIQLRPWLVAIRRDFHRYPELGMEEFRTRDKIIEYLTEMGIPYEKDIAETAVVGLIKGKKQGRTVALRGDMDALPIQEVNDVPYKSKYDGKMHACGHDAHTTILLGAARLLNDFKDYFQGNIKLFFQPAEETVGGAKPMIEAGVMENPKVEAVFGLHVAPQLPTGKVEVIYDQMNASSDPLYLTVKGTHAHGAYPQQGVDAIVIAAHVITALQTIISRNIDPRQAAVLSIGIIEGGSEKNIIAQEVKMRGTLRTLNKDVRDRVLARIEEVLAHITQSMGGDYTFKIGTDGYVALVNDRAMVDLVRRSGECLLGAKNVHIMKEPSMGVEDFAYFAEAAPSAFYRLGCRNEDKGIIHDVHTNMFDIDEECLPIGVALQVKNTLNFLST